MTLTSTKTILVVDDNPENIHILVENLEAEYTVKFATSGRQALDIAFSQDQPDLILLDIMMPDMDGYEVCARLKANADTWDIPIIFVTALNQEVDETKGLQLGAVDYITKPFSRAVVGVRIKSALLLKEEMDSRLQLTVKLESLNKNLEQRIKERTKELEQAYEDLRLSEKRYRAIYENAIEGIFQSSQDGRFMTASPSLARILGYQSSRELISLVTDIGHQLYVYPEDRDELSLILDQQGEVSNYETRFKKKNDDVIWVMICAKKVLDKTNDTCYYQGFLTDITAQKLAVEENEKLELQLRQAQKMEAIGTLAGGIAHDFNNILSAIFGYTELARLRLPANSKEGNFLAEVLAASNRAKKLVAQILTFSRRTEQERKPLDIHLVVQEALKLLRSSIPSTIKINAIIDKESGAVLADPTQIHQIMMNLCTNAYHAMQEAGGTLNVELSAIDIDKDDEKVAAMYLNPGPYLLLFISDTGPGMNQATLERIFEPYFTTKKKGKGTGLGLALVHGIIKNHGGYIAVDSEPGKGTSFYIYLPKVVAKETVGEEETDHTVPCGNENILVVDDEQYNVEILKEVLSGLGYKVTGTTDCEQAMQLFRTHSEDFDLLVTDMTMPQMTGAELAKRFIEIRADIPIVLCTGFSDLLTEEQAKAIGISEYLMKPITREALAKVVRKIMDGGRR